MKLSIDDSYFFNRYSIRLLEFTTSSANSPMAKEIPADMNKRAENTTDGIDSISPKVIFS